MDFLNTYLHRIYVTTSSIMINDLSANDSDITIQLSAASPIVMKLGLQFVTWDLLRVATNGDQNMVKLVEIVENGMPEFRHDLCVNIINLGKLWV